MTADEWLAKVMADRPPWTPAQVALLRPILAPAFRHAKSAAPAAEAGPHPVKPNPKGKQNDRQHTG